MVKMRPRKVKQFIIYFFLTDEVPPHFLFHLYSESPLVNLQTLFKYVHEILRKYLNDEVNGLKSSTSRIFKRIEEQKRKQKYKNV